MSFPIEPVEVSVVVATFQSAAGSDARPEANPAANEEEAASTVALVFTLIAVWLLVMAEPSDEVAT